jgi:uncharacterized membrane protein
MTASEFFENMAEQYRLQGQIFTFVGFIFVYASVVFCIVGFAKHGISFFTGKWREAEK